MGLPEHFDGKFETLHKISEGGMGEVYKVRHLLLDQIQVIKVIRSQHVSDEDVQLRFRREARTAIRLRHPNIAALHDFSIGEGGTAYIVMEYIDGKTLKNLLEECGPPAVDLTIEIALQSLDALSYLHRRGYVHRDISPDNLMLTHNFDGSPLIKLIDLGLAKSLAGPSNLTATGMFMGKARYSSPEQFDGKTELDQRTDIYSFGVMFYELLTGACPIQGEDFSTLVASHLFRPPLEFEASDPNGRIPQELREIVLRTIEKKPDDRVATAAELARLLEPFRSLGKPGGSVTDPAQMTVALPAAPGSAKEIGGPAATAAAPTVLIPSTVSDRQRSAEDAPQPPKSGKLKLILGLAAAIALPLAWWALSNSPSVPPVQVPAVQLPVAEEKYLLALEQISADELLAARQLLGAALEADPAESSSPDWVTPGQKGPYIPHFLLGLVYFEMNNCVAALPAWEESERQGVIQKAAQYEELVRSKSECESRYAETIQRDSKLLEDAARYANLLEEALSTPALESMASPQLVADARSALQDFLDVQTRFERAKAEEDFGAVLSLETDLVESEEKLNELLDAFSS